MFKHGECFNQSLENWTFDKNPEMKDIFLYCHNLNQTYPLTKNSHLLDDWALI